MKINSFYYGNKLNKLEELTIKSFLSNGHEFDLYTYDKNITDYKDNKFNIVNANEILDKSNFFTYKGFGDCPNNSVGGFSDIFRFNLLKKVPGWYVDMDVTCLKSFNDFNNTEIVLRPHNSKGVVANIIKCNNISFIEYVIEEYTKYISFSNDNWVKPLEILNDAVSKYNLNQYIVSNEIFGDDSADILFKMINSNVYELDFIPKYAIHWCNTACTTSIWNRKLKVDWNSPRLASLYYCIFKKYNV